MCAIAAAAQGMREEKVKAFAVVRPLRRMRKDKLTLYHSSAAAAAAASSKWCAPRYEIFIITETGYCFTIGIERVALSEQSASLRRVY
jgi:hypothetical protein